MMPMPRTKKRVLNTHVTIRIMVVVAGVIITSHIILLQGYLGRLERVSDAFVSPRGLFDHIAENQGKLLDAEIIRKEDITFSIADILGKAGVDLTSEPDVRRQLPKEEDVVRLYGPKPIIKGLDRCSAFRDSVPAVSRMMAPAGMFNTGTNLINQLLRENCYIPERVKKIGKGSPGMRRQVPWGKHSPASWRLKNKALEAGGT